MQNQSLRLTLADIARIVNALVYDSPYEAVVSIRGVVEYNDRLQAIDVKAPTYMAMSILRYYADAVALSIAVKDMATGITGLRIGLDPIDEMNDMDEILVRCEMTAIPSKKSEDINTSELLRQMLEEKFGKI